MIPNKSYRFFKALIDSTLSLLQQQNDTIKEMEKDRNANMICPILLDPKYSLKNKEKQYSVNPKATIGVATSFRYHSNFSVLMIFLCI
jgi:hypothetical protein